MPNAYCLASTTFSTELGTLNILFVGDIFGSAGRRIVREHIGHVREAHQVDLTIVNVENAAGGFGVTPQIAEEVFDVGRGRADDRQPRLGQEGTGRLPEFEPKSHSRAHVCGRRIFHQASRGAVSSKARRAAAWSSR